MDCQPERRSADPRVERTLEALARNASLGKHEVTVLGHKFTVLPGVYSPAVFSDTEFFANHLPETRGLDVLEIGTGSGVLACLLAMDGAKKVLATDLNPTAVENASVNALRYQLSRIVTCRVGSVFDPLLLGVDLFDVIYWNVPFMNDDVDNRQHPLLFRAVFDPRGQAKRRFARGAAGYLKRGGALYAGFSSSYGDLDDFMGTLADAGLKPFIWKVGTTAFAGESMNMQVIKAEK